MTSPPVDSILKNRLTVTHLALVRGWVQGIELHELAERYLAGIGDYEGGGVDLRLAKSSLMRVLDTIANLARRLGLKDSITFKRQASRIRVAPNAPTLEDFAQTLADPDFYSESELIELYQARYSRSLNAGGRSESRRARLIARQLNVITDLAHHLVAPMSLHDGVDLWFEEGLSARLVKAGYSTIESLAIAMLTNPAGWFESVDAVGIGKAERIKNFIVAQRGSLEDVRIPPSLMPKAVASSGFMLLLDCSAVPAPVDSLATATSHQGGNPALNGSNGRLRSADGRSAIAATNDLEALNTWLRLKTTKPTVTLYRREVQRLMMWCTRIKGIPLSSMSIEDALDYKDFLGNVPADWICKKGTPQSWPQWTPFAGSLTPSSIKKALVIVQAFFTWCVGINYCVANPFIGVKPGSSPLVQAAPSTSADDDASTKAHQNKQSSLVTNTLSQPAILAIERYLGGTPEDEVNIRSRFIFRFAYMTGLRISELAAARIGHIERIDPTALDEGGWILSVIGKRDILREVPLPASLIHDLCGYLTSRGLPGSISQSEPGTFLIGKLPSKTSKLGDGVKPQTIHLALKTLFQSAIDGLGIDDQKARSKLELASAHWLRHTCATNAVAANVPLDVISSTLGHSSLTTTSRYIHAEGRRKLKEMQAFWNVASGGIPPTSGD